MFMFFWSSYGEFGLEYDMVLTGPNLYAAPLTWHITYLMYVEYWEGNTVVLCEPLLRQIPFFGPSNQLELEQPSGFVWRLPVRDLIMFIWLGQIRLFSHRLDYFGSSINWNCRSFESFMCINLR